MIRTVHLNDIEPALMSMRSPLGFDLVLDLDYRNADDTKLSTDLAATLVLQGRSTNGVALTYLAAAIDVVNGKARVLVPGGDLTDVNGYQATLIGTVGGARQVIGYGVLALTGSGASEIASADIIDTIDLRLAYGVDAVIIVALWHDVGKTSPIDLSVVTLTATVLSQAGGVPLASFGVTTIDNRATLTMLAATVATLPAACWWTLAASNAAGVQTLAQGNVTIT